MYNLIDKEGKVIKPKVPNQLTLSSPKYYNLRTTCNSHGWKELAPFVWDDKSCTLGATVSVSGEADREYSS